MQPEDRIRLRHMLDSARAVQSFTAGRKQEDLAGDLQLLWAIVRGIEIIGEAAAKISPETRDLLPDVPWRAIVSMRNRLIHGYFDVNPLLVWKTVEDDLPPLIEKVEAALRQP